MCQSLGFGGERRKRRGLLARFQRPAYKGELFAVPGMGFLATESLSGVALWVAPVRRTGTLHRSEFEFSKTEGGVLAHQKRRLLTSGIIRFGWPGRTLFAQRSSV